MTTRRDFVVIVKIVARDRASTWSYEYIGAGLIPTLYIPIKDLVISKN